MTFAACRFREPENLRSVIIVNRKEGDQIFTTIGCQILMVFAAMVANFHTTGCELPGKRPIGSCNDPATVMGSQRKVHPGNQDQQNHPYGKRLSH